jgi:hypothetical protein
MMDQKVLDQILLEGPQVAKKQWQIYPPKDLEITVGALLKKSFFGSTNGTVLFLINEGITRIAETKNNPVLAKIAQEYLDKRAEDDDDNNNSTGKKKL